METVGVTAETEEEAAVIAEDIVAVIAVHLTEVTVVIGVTVTAVMVIVVEAVTVEAVAVEAAAAAMNAHRTKQGQVTAAVVQMTTTADREVTIGMVHLHRQKERGDMNQYLQEAMEVLPLVGRHHLIIMRSVQTGFKLSVFHFFLISTLL